MSIRKMIGYQKNLLTGDSTYIKVKLEHGAYTFYNGRRRLWALHAKSRSEILPVIKEYRKKILKQRKLNPLYEKYYKGKQIKIVYRLMFKEK